MLKGLQWFGAFASCVLAAAIACVLIARSWDGLSVLPVVHAQDALPAGSKFIEVEPENAYQAARVVKVTVGKQVVTLGFHNPRGGPTGVPFQAGDDWLKGLAFTVKNRTTKKIVKLFMDVSLGETEKPEYGPPIDQSIYLGRIPGNAAYGPDGKKFDQGAEQPLDFGPGQEMTFSFSDYADGVRKRIEERQPFSTVTRCFINVHTAYLEDGTSWVLSHFQVRDPSHPGSVIPLDPSLFFSGDPDADK
jgi:hypothetical protein